MVQLLVVSHVLKPIQVLGSGTQECQRNDSSGFTQLHVFEGDVAWDNEKIVSFDVAQAALWCPLETKEILLFFQWLDDDLTLVGQRRTFLVSSSNWTLPALNLMVLLMLSGWLGSSPNV